MLFPKLYSTTILSICVLLCFSELSHAQTSNNVEQDIYFASGQTILSQEAEQNLNDLFEKLNATQLKEVELQAFTDDIGSKTQNDKIAQQRANAVKTYLIDNNIDNDKIEILASTQLVLDPNAADVDEQRRKSRRVHIRFYLNEEKEANKEAISAKPVDTEEVIVPLQRGEALANFFEEEREKAVQTFSVDGSKGKVLKGEKGTLLQIPPNCFVTESGEAVIGNVNIYLQEALSISDLLLQNLGTITTEGEILETGGTIRLDIRDEAGNSLQIREGSGIGVSVPTEGATEKGMRLYDGEIDAVTGNVEWAENQTMIGNAAQDGAARMQFIVNPQARLTGADYEYNFTGIRKHQENLENKAQFDLNLPRMLTKPKFKLRFPRAVRPRVALKPNREEMMEKYPQGAKEKGYEYKKRIYKIYFREQHKYRIARNYNRRKFSQFKRDSLSYVRAKTKFDDRMATYVAYNETLRGKAFGLKEQFKLVDVLSIDKSSSYLTRALLNSKNRAESLSLELDRLRVNLTAYVGQGYEVFEPLRKNSHKMKAASISKPTQRKLTSLGRFYEQQTKYLKNNLYKKEKSTDKVKTLKNRLKSKIRRLNYLTNKMDKEGLLRPSHIKSIHRLFTQIQDQAKFKYLERMQDRCTKQYSKCEAEIKEYIDKQEAIVNLSNQIWDLRNEVGVLTGQELGSEYRNYTVIDRVPSGGGYFNWDRPIPPVETRIRLNIDVEPDPNVMIYAVIGNRSVICAESTKSNYCIKRMRPDDNIRLLGVKMGENGETSEFFEMTGTVKSLKNCRPVFQSKNVAQIKNMLVAME